MNARVIQRKNGFTLIELLVVVAVIALLTAGILTVLFEARKQARDLARISDAEQLKLGIRLLKEANNQYPNYNSGIEIGAGRSIDTQLAPFLKDLHTDPLWSGLGGTYGYMYYSNYSCGGSHEVIIVKNMELPKNSNYRALCGGGTSNRYIVLIN